VDGTREGTSQIGNLESYSCPLNVKHLKRNELSSFEDSETNILFLNSSFLRSLLRWVLVNVPNFVSTNLIDLICFLHCSSLYG